MNDDIGKNNIFYIPLNTYFYTFDRLNNPVSAIYLKNSFFQFPSDIYFNSDFTIILWFSLKELNQQYLSFVDFGNGVDSDNIVIGYYKEMNQFLIYILNSDDLSNKYLYSDEYELKIDVWYQLIFVLKSNIGSLYLNGNLIGSNELNTPNNIIRYYCYIGKSNYDLNSNLSSVFDLIQFYKGAFDSNQVLNDYLKNTPGKFNTVLI